MPRHFGTKVTKEILNRLSEFNAASNLSEIPAIPPSHCHELKGNLKGRFAVNVSRNYRLIFEGYDQNDNFTTNKPDIVTIQIISLIDYH